MKIVLSTTVGFAAGIAAVGYTLTRKKLMTRAIVELMKKKDFSPTEEQMRVVREIRDGLLK